MKLIKIVIPCLLLGACVLGTSKNAKFYTPKAINAGVVSADYKAFVGVNRSQLPKYMERPQIVTHQKDSAQIKISEYNRWAEYPSVLLTRVVAEDLSHLLPASKVKPNQGKAERFDYTISLEVTEMKAVLGGNVELTAWYTIKNQAGKTLTQQKFTHSMKVGKSYEDLMKGYNELLAQLSYAIAEHLIAK